MNRAVVEWIVVVEDLVGGISGVIGNVEIADGADRQAVGVTLDEMRKQVVCASRYTSVKLPDPLSMTYKSPAGSSPMPMGYFAFVAENFQAAGAGVVKKTAVVS